jgi:hypothetical protein
VVQGAISGSAGHHKAEVYDVVHGGVLVYDHSTLRCLAWWGLGLSAPFPASVVGSPGWAGVPSLTCIRGSFFLFLLLFLLFSALAAFGLLSLQWRSLHLCQK